MRRELQLSGSTVLIIGGSSGIGLETARQARSEGANLILTGPNADRLHSAGLELGASIAAFDATNFDRLERFFDELPGPIDHLLLPGGDPYDSPFAELSLDEARRDAERHLWLPLRIAQLSMDAIRPGGCLVFIGGAAGRRPSARPLHSALTAAMAALTRSLALELAPVRVNLVGSEFVETPHSAATLGDQPDGRREGLRATLPIRRVVGPADVAALAIHLMTNAAITGAVLDIDGGQQLLA